MGLRQKGINSITLGVESYRMSAGLSLHRFDSLRFVGLKDIHYARISDGDV